MLLALSNICQASTASAQSDSNIMMHRWCTTVTVRHRCRKCARMAGVPTLRTASLHHINRTSRHRRSAVETAILTELTARFYSWTNRVRGEHIPARGRFLLPRP